MAQGTCRECAAEDRYLPGRGLCAGCYDRRWKTGTLDAFPCLPRIKPAPTYTRKPCRICKQVLPLESFPRSNKNKDGRGSYCSPCARQKYHIPARQRQALVEQHFDGDQECRKCGETKPVSRFNWDKSKGKYTYQCKDCRAINGRKHWRELESGRQWVKSLKKFGLSEQDYLDMLAGQAGGCAICGRTSEEINRMRLAVDHCHVTGRIRALLCGSCNTGIGMFKDNPELLVKAAIYTELHKQE